MRTLRSLSRRSRAAIALGPTACLPMRFDPSRCDRLSNPRAGTAKCSLGVRQPHPVLMRAPRLPNGYCVLHAHDPAGLRDLPALPARPSPCSSYKQACSVGHPTLPEHARYPIGVRLVIGEAPQTRGSSRGFPVNTRSAVARRSPRIIPRGRPVKLSSDLFDPTAASSVMKDSALAANGLVSGQVVRCAGGTLNRHVRRDLFAWRGGDATRSTSRPRRLRLQPGTPAHARMRGRSSRRRGRSRRPSGAG